MDAQIIFDKSKKFHIDGQEKNGILFARVKAVRVDEYVIVDKTYSLDEWLTEPERSWRKPLENIDAYRVTDEYESVSKAVEVAEYFFSSCNAYTETDLTPLFLQQQESETLAVSEAARAQ